MAISTMVEVGRIAQVPQGPPSSILGQKFKSSPGPPEHLKQAFSPFWKSRSLEGILDDHVQPFWLTKLKDSFRLVLALLKAHRSET